MYDVPSPTHGFFSVIVAFWVYIGLVGASMVGARELGALAGVALLVPLVVGALLLKPFWSVSRRLMPSSRHENNE
jgi:hypothetical protein